MEKMTIRTSPDDRFNPKFRLPLNLRIISAGTHLYKMGLSLYPVESVKRRIWRYPLFLFLLETYYILRSLLVLVSPEKELLFYKILGDFGYVFGTRVHFALTVTFSILLTFNSHLLNYFNYKKKIKPNYMKVFAMLSGSTTPQSCGITSEQIIMDLISRTKILFFIGDYVPLSLASTIFCINCFSFYSNSSPEEMVLYVLPNSVGWFVIVNIVYNLIIWQMIYFYLITFYLKSKIKEINQNLKQFLEGPPRKPISFSRTAQDLSALYTEITEYDTIYWSQFLSFIWMTCATILSTLTFFIIFGEMLFIIRICCLYFDLFFVFLLILTVNTCATVHREANNSYKLLNSLMTEWNRHSHCKGMKLLNLIERIGEKKIGFHCWKLFIINSFRGYEIISFCVVLFMKVIEMSL